ncbi:thiamine-phosphate kinase [Aristophania vespae]|uniref:Thiamine-monophosphate kinase n=1 Tax=Aristophania vespae TaxID=2697033 RepID=A0A6P1NF80_9PROT|nr:thiamine-phosphate kinase [Aristophania vespae]QHI95547.1 thiamine-phosphate kinase [Aristophania vespae]
MGEFDFIGRHFKSLAGEGAFDLRNDGAVISLTPNHELVVSTDTMVENRHFLPFDPPKTIGQKLLRCNLSDLAAMGAEPLSYTLNVTVPLSHKYSDEWFKAFAEGLAEDQKRFKLFLLGGDTTASDGPMVFTLTIFGRVSSGKALRRDMAKEDDSVWVTGTLGAAALGLHARLKELDDPSHLLTKAYLLPEPRLGLSLHGIVSACMDISDGVLQDANHIAEESGVHIDLYESELPMIEATRNAPSQWEKTRLLGGDDYELLLTCPKDKEDDLVKECLKHQVKITRIGRVSKGHGVQMLAKNGQPIKFDKLGWQHF